MQYKEDLVSASSEHAVLVIDYSQNHTIPSVASTPSQWYFMSLVAVYVFGVYYANEAKQYNFVYTEREAGKGSNKINSMLRKFVNEVIAPGTKHLTVYADNCGGQNKNNFVLKFLLALAHSGEFEEVNYHFFVKGHTKNACDRGFGHTKKKVVRRDCWIFGEIVRAIQDAAVTSFTISLAASDVQDYKAVVSELYKDIKGIQKYQLFKMHKAYPGVVECRVGPCDVPLQHVLRRLTDGVLTSPDIVRTALQGWLKPTEAPKPNPEKIFELFTSIRPYVPQEYLLNEMYREPSRDELLAVKAKKKLRRKQASKNSAPDAPAKRSSIEPDAQPPPPTKFARKI